MKMDQVKGGIKVFTGGEAKSAEEDDALSKLSMARGVEGEEVDADGFRGID
jgi:hypothetical protein